MAPSPLTPPPALLQAFSCIDQNRDGIITKEDLKETYLQLGQRHRVGTGTGTAAVMSRGGDGDRGQ